VEASATANLLVTTEKEDYEVAYIDFSSETVETLL
jgi:hypothetical protein